ncbi:MAG: PhoH family protein [Tidjanibacter sp.]|nr:PhoH family protein [Tidjanibacter sp.]MBQ5807707.1 PhoH family protein [Tidjanibacter sp.]MBQ5931404.1 PhoH family protein [Tidjanibacter sp.]
MAEKSISIDGIDLLDFYGVANSNFNRICDLFPKLKIVARGEAIKAIGTDEEIERLEKRVEALGEYYNKYGHISPSVINQIFQGGLPQPEGGIMPSDVIVYGNNGLIVKARTENQQKLVDLYGKNDLLFAIGPAGSGKTYTAIALAVGALKNREVKRIILTRPAVEAGERLGFLPGDMKEKLDPYLQPLYDALNDMIPPAKLQRFLEEGVVQIAPLAYMRGRTLDNAFVILDEAQNTTLPQIKMFLTRMGRNAKFIVTGDLTQIDLPRKSDSGLKRAVDMLHNIEGIGIVEFGKKDIIRHSLVSQIVKAFDSHEEDSATNDHHKADNN